MSFEPARSANQVEPVTAVNVTFSKEGQSASTPYVVEGEVSQSSLGKLETGELTSALAERIVPSITCVVGGGWRIRPQVPLRVGGFYSVVSKYGLHGVFRVGPAINAFMSRIWPPTTSGAYLGIFCGDVAPTEFADTHLDGSSVRAQLLPGLNDEGMRAGSCVRLAWGNLGSAVVQPPPAFAQFSFDPAVLPTGLGADESKNVVCTNGEISIGPGCALPQSGTITVRPPPGSSLWALKLGNRYHLQSTIDGQRFVIPDLGLQRAIDLSVTVFDAAGRSVYARVHVELPAPAPHLVISEVMANPVGPEPAQEWVEVFNAGTLAGNLAELSLADSEAAVALPSTLLEPGAFVLLVREDFDATAFGDVRMPPNARLVRIAQLSKSGLSNAGEPLSLAKVDGTTVSRFPSVAAKAAGVSVARRFGWSLDEDATAFASHGAPGASPGAVNQFDDK